MISPVVDERTRTLRVKALLPNADGRLRPGLFARTDLGIAKRANVVLVPEEAVLQLELLGHNFFVFTNAESDQVNVLYRRNDGHIGLIEPMPRPIEYQRLLPSRR